MDARPRGTNVKRFFTQVTSIDALRPVAVEGDTLLSFAAFIPFSLLAIAAAAFARSTTLGATCRMWASSCRSVNGVPIHPISLGVGVNRLSVLNVEVLRLHGTKAKWVGVAGCRPSSSGWPAGRVYEVISSGGLPYVADLDDCPRYTLHAMNKPLLAKVRALPLLPWPSSGGTSPGASGGSVASFNSSSPLHGRLVTLHRELLVHARAHLTHAAIGRHVIEHALGASALAAWRRQALRSKGLKGLLGGPAAAAANGTSSRLGASRLTRRA